MVYFFVSGRLTGPRTELHIANVDFMKCETILLVQVIYTIHYMHASCMYEKEDFDCIDFESVLGENACKFCEQ